MYNFGIPPFPLSGRCYYLPDIDPKYDTTETLRRRLAGLDDVTRFGEESADLFVQQLRRAAQHNALQFDPHVLMAYLAIRQAQWLQNELLRCYDNLSNKTAAPMMVPKPEPGE